MRTPRGCLAFHPRMQSSGEPGTVVNVGSKQGITVPPGNLKYYAEGLEHHLQNVKGGRIRPALLVPGWVNKSIALKAAGWPLGRPRPAALLALSRTPRGARPGRAPLSESRTGTMRSGGWEGNAQSVRHGKYSNEDERRQSPGDDAPAAPAQSRSGQGRPRRATSRSGRRRSGRTTHPGKVRRAGKVQAARQRLEIPAAFSGRPRVRLTLEESGAEGSSGAQRQASSLQIRSASSGCCSLGK